MNYPHSINIKYVFNVLTAICCSAFLCISGSYGQTSSKKISDTAAFAHKMVAEKRLKQANKLLKGYVSRNPKDLDATWLNAQTNTWLANYGQADTLYKRALALDADNKELQADYARSLMYMGRFGKAEKLLKRLDADDPEIAFLWARLYYWTGKMNAAFIAIDKAIALSGDSGEAAALKKEMQMARALKVGLGGSYLTDNQPYETYSTDLKVEQYRNKWLHLSVLGNMRNYVQPFATTSQWATVNNKMYLSALKLHVNYGGGAVMFPYKKSIDWLANVGLKQELGPHFSLELYGDRNPYMDTRKSLDTNLSAYRFAAKLNFSKREWSAQAAYLNSRFADKNNVTSKYAWIVAPLWITDISKLHIGYSISYSTSDKSRYSPQVPLSQILNNFDPNYVISGIYNPYFTPVDMLSNSALLSFTLKATSWMTFSVNGDIGTGTTQNPYLYLNRDSATAPVYIATGYSKEQFTPYSVTAVATFNPAKTWQVSARYIYRSTYFFNSSLAGITLEKSFLPRSGSNRGTASTFGESITDIEKRLAALDKCKDRQQMWDQLSSIRKAVVSLRAKQDRILSHSELSPDSEEAAVLQDRLDNLDEMLREIDSVEAELRATSIGERSPRLPQIAYHGSTAEL